MKHRGNHRAFGRVFILQFSSFILFSFALSSLSLSAVGPGTTLETFDTDIGTWDRVDWVAGSMTDENDTSPADGLPDSIQIAGGQLSVTEAYRRGVVHLELDSVPTDAGVRLDATMWQGLYGSNMEHWGMAVVIFFDQNNFVSLARVRANGGGWMRFQKVNGAFSTDLGNVGLVDEQWVMQGIEITPTQVKFYASPRGVDQFGATDFDAQMTEDLSNMTFPRPASFVGNATLIVGKGWDHVAGDPWDMQSDLVDPKVVGIDTTRVVLQSTATPGDPTITNITVAAGNTAVSFETVLGKAYRLQSTPDPTVSNFTDTGTFVVGDGNGMALTDPVAGPDSMIYRVSEAEFDLGAEPIPAWDIDPYENFTETRAPTSVAPPLQNIDVQLAQGEFRDALFMVGPQDGGEIVVDIQVDDFGALPAGMILVQETLYVRNLGNGQPDTFTGDAVYPLTTPLVVPANESRQVRLRFDAKYSGVLPGVYPFNVTLTETNSSEQLTIPGTVEVWDFDLPSIDELPSHNWVQIKATSWSGQVLENGIQEMKPYGPNYIYVSHTELPLATVVDANGNIFSMNYNSFDYRVSSPLNAWQAGAGSEKLKYVFFLLDLSLGQTDDGLGSIITYPSAAWNTLFADWIGRMRSRLQTMYGLGNDDWMLVLGDEVGDQELMDYTIPLAETIKSIDPAVTLNSNSSVILAEPWASRYYAAFDIFQPNLQHVESNPAILTFLQASGKELWTYKAAGFCGSLGFDVYRYYRSYGWRMVNYGMTGIGLWTYCANQGGAAQYDWPGYNPAGIQTSLGHILVWQHWANNDIVHCRRYEMYRETTDDYRYILRLRELAAAAGGQAPADAEALIDQAITDIIDNNSDHTRCDFWRKQIAAEILSL